MPLFRATNILRVTGLAAEDDIMSTAHFTHPDADPPSADLDKLAKAFSSIWVNMKNNLASSVVGTAGAHRVRISRIENYQSAGESDDVQTSPLYDFGYTLSPVGGNTLPHELAAVVSFKPDLEGVFEQFGASRPRQRRRGRFYFGPLSTVNLASDGRWATGLTDGLKNNVILHLDHAGEVTLDRLAGTQWRWVTYSRAEGLVWQVKDVHVDNAPDVQRSRGVKSTARSTGTLVGS